jgi:hypothetical protein
VQFYVSHSTFVIFLSPISELQHALLPLQNATSQGACPDSLFFRCFLFGTHIWVPQGVWERVISSSHEVRSPNASTFSMCQICNLIDHVATICSKIKDLKPKCGKWGLPHRTIICGLKCGYYTRMGHTKNKCWKKRKETKSHSTTNNYMEILVDDEVATLEQTK